jgi:hypothetical protein
MVRSLLSPASAVDPLRLELLSSRELFRPRLSEPRLFACCTSNSAVASNTNARPRFVRPETLPARRAVSRDDGRSRERSGLKICDPRVVCANATADMALGYFRRRPGDRHVTPDTVKRFARLPTSEFRNSLKMARGA